MITFYGDKITANFNDPHLWNRFLEQHIQDSDSGAQQFTVHPQFNSSAFKYLNTPVQFKNFIEYSNGQNVVVIGIHGGWNESKPDLIEQWFLKDPSRRRAWEDPKCQIIIDYCEEGFAYEVFPSLHQWIIKNNLVNRVLYISSSSNIKQQYQHWCKKNKQVPNMKVVWFGFFLKWDTRWCIQDKQTRLNKNYQKRFMCLNRRPWPHRILLLTLLERYNLLEYGAVSMPREFNEAEVHWKDGDFDIPAKWQELKERFNGYIDYLDNDFVQMYSSLPRIADTARFEVNHVLDLNESLYRNHPINLISETLFFTDTVFISEKITKPILFNQIFIVMSAPYYLQQLRELGFKTFHPYINEEYDLIEDSEERSHAVVKALADVVKLADGEFNDLLKKCEPIITHNKRLITDIDRIDRIISQQLVDEIENLWT